MKALTKAAWIWLILAALAIGWDVTAALLHWQTLSQWVWQTAPVHPLLPFAAGVLMGHLFWHK